MTDSYCVQKDSKSTSRVYDENECNERVSSCKIHKADDISSIQIIFHLELQETQQLCLSIATALMWFRLSWNTWQ